jgi:hypothetical protein
MKMMEDNPEMMKGMMKGMMEKAKNNDNDVRYVNL